MELPVYKMYIDPEDDSLQVDAVAFVKNPAIEKNFMAFSKDEFESYSDYPDGVKNNAKRVLEYVEENGWGSCGTAVGKQRANQLAKGEAISVETIQRMYSYLSRHEVDLDSSKSYGDGCGKLMYDAWGGKAALGWSRNKLRELGLLDKFNFSITNEEQRVVSGPLMLANTPIYRNDERGEYYVVFEPETIKQIVQKFFAQGFQGNVNLAHDPNQQVEDVFMFESWIVDSSRGIKPMEGFNDVPDGSWFGSFKVDNDDVWEKVKQGEFKGFSVEGFFKYKRKEDDLVTLLEKLSAILEQAK